MYIGDDVSIEFSMLINVSLYERLLSKSICCTMVDNNKVMIYDWKHFFYVSWPDIKDDINRWTLHDEEEVEKNGKYETRFSCGWWNKDIKFALCLKQCQIKNTAIKEHKTQEALN